MVPWAYDGGMDIASTSSARMRRVIEHLLALVRATILLDKDRAILTPAPSLRHVPDSCEEGPPPNDAWRRLSVPILNRKNGACTCGEQRKFQITSTLRGCTGGEG